MGIITEEIRRLGNEAKRKKSIDKYYENPNRCLNCNEIIHIKDGDKPYHIKVKKFCNKSCAATYNNKKYPKRKSKNPDKNKYINSKTCSCSICGEDIELTKNKSGYNRRKYCDKCLLDVRVANGVKSGKIRLKKYLEILSKTKKKDLYKKGSVSARTTINGNARHIYWSQPNPQNHCPICQYSKHVDVCHRVGISEFPDTATLAEINSLDNLFVLCENCHWEYDHDQMSEEARGKIK